jgi:PKD repeat protein
MRNFPTTTFCRLACTVLVNAAGLGCGGLKAGPPDAEVVVQPTAAFIKPDNIFERCPVKLTNSSTDATMFQWDFGMTATPASSVEKEPVVSFAAAGDQTISLTASNSGGAASTQQTATVRQAGTYLLADMREKARSGHSVSILSDGSSIAWEAGVSQTKDFGLGFFVTRAANGDILTEVAPPVLLFFTKIWATLPGDRIVISSIQFTTGGGAPFFSVVPASLGSTFQQYPIQTTPDGFAVILDMKVIGETAFATGVIDKTQFVAQYDLTTGLAKSFETWRSPTSSPNPELFDATIAVNDASMYVVAIDESESAKAVTIGHFDRQTGKLISTGTSFLRRPSAVRETTPSMQLVNDKLIISDDAGTYGVSVTGEQVAIAGAAPNSELLVADDGGVVAVGYDASSKRIVMKRYDQGLKMVAEGRSDALAGADSYEVTGIAQGLDCSIVGVGRKTIGPDTYPLYFRFSANGRL